MDHTVRKREFQCSYMKPNENSKERGKGSQEEIV